MKGQHKEMINKQINILISEVEEISNVAERAKVRASLIEIMFNIATYDNIALDTGKESIKEDTAKEVVEEEIDFTPEDVEEQPEDVKEALDELAEGEPENDPFDDAEEIPFNLEQTEPEKVTVEDDEGNVFDITEEYNYLGDDLEDEDKREICLQIKEYDSFEDYKLLDMLPNGYSRSIIALTMTALGTDVVDQAVEAFNDGHYENLFKFLNANNCDEFAQYLVDNYFEQ
jgi:hypothetical protein